MNYADMHCDTLTVCRLGGGDLAECGLQTDIKRLARSGCKAQCFAIFTNGAGAKEEFLKHLAFFGRMLEKHGDIVLQAKTSGDLLRAEREQKLAAILTVENLGFTQGDISSFGFLKAEGVKMASLVWNTANDYARPNLVLKNGVPSPYKSESRGLTKLGRQAVDKLDGLKIIIDVSHLSDGGVDEILQNRKIPVVASHSNARKVCGVGRNLTDSQIKKIADCGGLVGINFHKDFLGEEGFSGVCKHLEHIIKVGGEDIPAFGSDFDGISPSPQLESCLKMPALLDYLSGRFSFRVLEKVAYKNFYGVFKQFD